MQSEAQLMLGISKGTETGAPAGSRPEKKEASGAASAFLELFSGSLAQSYENDAISTKDTRFVERAEQSAPEPRTVDRAEPERRSERFEVERNERPERDERGERVSNAKERRDDAATKRPRNEGSNADKRVETTERKTAQTRGENTGETKQKTETANTEPRDKASAKAETAAENQTADSKRVVARSNAQARALANLLNANTKSEADENVSRQVEQLVKTSARVVQQTQAVGNQAQENSVRIKPSTPEAAVAAKAAATAKVAESSARNVEVSTSRPNAVQAAEAPKNANTQASGEQQAGNNNSAPNSPNASPVAQEAVRLAQQHNRSFASAVKEAAQNVVVSKAGASSAAGNSQVALSNAAGQYSRAATHVFNTPRAQAPVQAQPSQVISQLIRAAKISMQNGREEMKILLKPEQLGWLKVKITVEGNRVTAHFGAENEYVRGLLEGNISQLQQALQNNNMKINQIQIDVAGQQQQGQNPHSGAAGDGNGRNGAAGNGENGSEAGVEESTAEELYYLQDTAALELSAVDVMI